MKPSHGVRPIFPGLLITGALVMSAAVAAPAQAVSDLEVVPTSTPASIEASRVANELAQAKTEGFAEIALFDVRIADTPGTEVRAAQFPIPSGCVVAEENALRCGDESISLIPAVLSLNGMLLDSEISVATDSITITAEPIAEVFALYAASESDRLLAEQAPGALASLLTEDAAPTSGVVDEDENPPIGEDEEPTGEWEEGDIEEVEAPASELGSDYAPGPAEFLIAPIPAVDAVTASGAYKRPASFVTVPSNYVYCTTWTAAKCKPKNLHDYCSVSPDSFKYKTKLAWSEVSFRGPCARHDLAIDSIRKKNISLASKKTQRRNADSTFKSQLRQNCGYKLYTSTIVRAACFGQASIYWTFVNSATNSWDGK